MSCVLRPYRLDDADALARTAGDFAVARWMAAGFPHPYGAQAAREWVHRTSAETPTDHFVIDVDGQFAGGAGLFPHSGERSGVAEFGYWLGCVYWGRGIASQAAQLLAAYALGERKLRRLEAHVFAPNLASVRVLEKSGFVREAVLRDVYVERDGMVVDGLLYAKLASQHRTVIACSRAGDRHDDTVITSSTAA